MSATIVLLRIVMAGYSLMLAPGRMMARSSSATRLTPFRPNNDPIITTDEVPGCFDEVVYSVPLMGLIAQGYLSPIVAKGLFLEGLDLAKVRTSHGDYVEADLAAALLAADAPEHLVRGYQEYAQGRRALIF